METEDDQWCPLVVTVMQYIQPTVEERLTIIIFENQRFMLGLLYVCHMGGKQRAAVAKFNFWRSACSLSILHNYMIYPMTK